VTYESVGVGFALGRRKKNELFRRDEKKRAVLKSPTSVVLNIFKMGQLLPPETPPNKTKARQPKVLGKRRSSYFILQRGRACWNSSSGVSEREKAF
jgi:hypothetical protein